jgi:hypothetical protein
MPTVRVATTRVAATFRRVVTIKVAATFRRAATTRVAVTFKEGSNHKGCSYIQGG